MLKNSLHPTKRELQALITVLGLSIFVLVVSEIISNSLLKREDLIDYSQIIKKLDAEPKHNAPDLLHPEIFSLDTVSSNWLKDRGLPKIAAHSLVNYSQKGGKIHNKTDLKRLYGFNDSIVDTWDRYIIYHADNQHHTSQTYVKKKHVPVPIPFTLDTVSIEWLVSHGMSKFIASNIISYRNKGGRFKTLIDLAKVYGINDSTLTFWSEYINFAESENKIPDVPQMLTIELNSASVDSLILIRGIGTTFAHQIINYRKRLGGFYTISQLSECGINDTLLHKSNQVLVNINLEKIQKIEINSISVKQLKNHPYMDFYKAKAIYSYRRNKKIKTLKEFYDIPDLDTIGLYKMEPYLNFD